MGAFIMAYTRVRDESPEPSGIGKEKPGFGLLKITAQLSFYRNLFYIILGLWVITLVILGWLFVSIDRVSGNHAASSLPFHQSKCHFGRVYHSELTS